MQLLISTGDSTITFLEDWISEVTALPSGFSNKAQEDVFFTCAAPFSIHHRNMTSITFPMSEIVFVKLFLFLLSPLSLRKALLQHIVGSLPDHVIKSSNLLTGEGAAGAVGGGQEICDSLYGAVNYHRASTYD